MFDGKIYGSRSYWNNYIDCIIDAIKEDKDTILEKHTSYEIEIVKMAEKSPFREEEDGE